MNRLTQGRRVQVVKALVEGNSINGTVRMTGVAKNTVLKLLADLGSACLDYQEVTLRNLTFGTLSATRYGSSATPKRRTSPWSTRASLATGMCGRGRPLMPIRNLYLAGTSVDVEGGTHGIS